MNLSRKGGLFRLQLHRVGVFDGSNRSFIAFDKLRVTFEQSTDFACDRRSICNLFNFGWSTATIEKIGNQFAINGCKRNRLSPFNEANDRD